MERDEVKKKILQQFSVEASQQLSHHYTIDRGNAMVQEQHRIKHPRSFHIYGRPTVLSWKTFQLFAALNLTLTLTLNLIQNLALSVTLILIYLTPQP